MTIIILDNDMVSLLGYLKKKKENEPRQGCLFSKGTWNDVLGDQARQICMKRDSEGGRGETSCQILPLHLFHHVDSIGCHSVSIWWVKLSFLGAWRR